MSLMIDQIFVSSSLSDQSASCQQSKRFRYFLSQRSKTLIAGERLGLMQSLAGMAAILSRFNVELAPESHPIHPPVETKFDVVQSIEGGLPLLFRERKKVV